ncbi:60S ribosomal protein L18a-like protein [Melia azedarach]|uniref:60S ribosomal protein L18a-like protein n=1 Tax=Melia azedarach TaxID=155640 RepID=A0ACC1XBR4_MELAZ|nr:60S ribosomal protein L18a-like protein [Melia azedarach]
MLKQENFSGHNLTENFYRGDTSTPANMDQSTTVGEKEGLKKDLELAKSVSDKHLDLLRPSARYYSASKDVSDRDKGRYTLIRDPEDFQAGTYDKPLPCFGCGIGWFSFLLGFVFPLMWYYATILYFGNYYRKDPRERAGLAASAIAAMACSVLLLVIVAFQLM